MDEEDDVVGEEFVEDDDEDGVDEDDGDVEGGVVRVS